MFVRKTIGWTGPVERSYLPFFFLGSGFMLVETKAITELGLHLGGTWFVIAATIVLVLVMAFLANWMVQRKIVPRTEPRLCRPAREPARRLFLGAQPRFDRVRLAAASALRSACVVLTIPLFFSGMVFSTLIGKPGINISTALAYNLMGALFGGLMEYNSMYFGFAFLYLLAMGFYGLAWLFSFESAAATRRIAAAARGS